MRNGKENRWSDMKTEHYTGVQVFLYKGSCKRERLVVWMANVIALLRQPKDTLLNRYSIMRSLLSDTVWYSLKLYVARYRLLKKREQLNQLPKRGGGATE